MADGETALEQLVYEELHDLAESAPAGTALLGRVHARSRQIGRRQRAGVAAGALLLAAVAAVAAPNLAGRFHGASGVEKFATAPAPTTATAAPTAPAFSLAPPRFAVPTLPWRPSTAPVGGLQSPVVTLDAGVVRGYYAAKDPERGTDVTVSVSAGQPIFGPAAGTVTEVPRTVGARRAMLRTVHVSPAAQLTLYWQDQAGRWVRLDTDDTLTDDQVVRLAERLGPAELAVVQPLAFVLAPEGMVLDTATPTKVAFRADPAGPGRIVCELVAAPPSGGDRVSVGGRQGRLTRTPEGVSLTVPLTDPAATLVVRAPAEFAVTDADLVRFVAGISLTDQAEPPSG